MAEIMSVLFFHTMKYRPEDPRNPSNDRFILSKVTHSYTRTGTQNYLFSIISRMLSESDCFKKISLSALSVPACPYQPLVTLWFRAGSRGSCAVCRVGRDGLPEGK